MNEAFDILCNELYCVWHHLLLRSV